MGQAILVKTARVSSEIRRELDRMRSAPAETDAEILGRILEGHRGLSAEVKADLCEALEETRRDRSRSSAAAGRPSRS